MFIKKKEDRLQSFLVEKLMVSTYEMTEKYWLILSVILA